MGISSKVGLLARLPSLMPLAIDILILNVPRTSIGVGMAAVFSVGSPLRPGIYKPGVGEVVVEVEVVVQVEVLGVGFKTTKEGGY